MVIHDMNGQQITNTRHSQVEVYQLSSISNIILAALYFSQSLDFLSTSLLYVPNVPSHTAPTCLPTPNPAYLVLHRLSRFLVRAI